MPLKTVVKNAKCSKIYLFTFNFIFLLIGIALFSLGIYAIIKFDSVAALSENNSRNLAISVIVIGFFICFITFMGCCGALRESRGMLKVYTIVLSILLFVEIAIAVVAYVFRAKARQMIQDNIDMRIANALPVPPRNAANSKEMFNVIINLQLQFECCGSTSALFSWGALDNSSKCFGVSVEGNNLDADQTCIPESCCTVGNRGQGCSLGLNPPIQQKGCTAALADYVEENMLGVGIAASIVLVFQVIGIMAGRKVMNEIDDANYV